ncbi:MAG: T9SS type A sorting domain-containing protein [bacterium]|nr:T9SS type A sorting domain-containing protein [bacterium]
MFMYIRLSVVLLVSFYCAVSVSHSELLLVPEEYPSISLAVQSVQPYDTISLAPGIYGDTIRPIVSLTIESRYRVSGDTNDIRNTVWNHTLGTTLIVISNKTICFRGLTFSAPGTPMLNRNLLLADSSRVLFEDCRFNGSYSTSTGRIIHLTGLSSLLITRCVFTGTEEFSSQLIRTHFDIEDNIRNSSFTGYPHNTGIRLIELNADTVVFSGCYVKSTGRLGVISGRRWFLIENSFFQYLCEDGIWLFASSERQSYVINCRFDSLIANSEHGDYLFSVNSAYPTGIVFENCIFSNCQTQLVGTSRGLIQGGTIRNSIYRNCEFRNNSMAATPFLHILSRGDMDSCRFIGNSINGSLFGWHFARDTIIIQNCDFIDNHITTFLYQNNTVMYAPNCYWGDPSGPHWVGNPNGLGLELPDNVNPVPWRTTPVFPETGVREPVTTLSPTRYSLSAYPNPFNSTLSIHWSGNNPPLKSITVFDALGRKVHDLPTTDFRGNRLLWKPTHLANGIYYLSVRDEHSVGVSLPVIYLK